MLQKNKTIPTCAKEIKREWHLIDAKGEILGRIAVKIAGALIGKTKPYYVAHLDCGDNVVVINAKEVAFTGQKEDQKKYYRHSGFPGGFKEITLADQMKKDPREVIKHAVAGMLPKNKLRDRRLTRLKIYSESTHPYSSKFKLHQDKFKETK